MKDSLPARKEILKQTPLYRGGDLLIDIGCAHGYFEVELASKYKKIIAFAPLQKEIELAKEATKDLKNVEVYLSTFGNFNFKELKADIVWVGNCLHYIFMEYRGFDFLVPLLTICKKYLIIEYPYDYEMDYNDTKILKENLVALKLDKLYNKKNIKKEFEKYFIIEQEFKSASPTREILVLRRKNES